ncbi:MAG: hypothetical protein MHM6MM_009038 [Cercozoa sp. M6MM]
MHRSVLRSLRMHVGKAPKFSEWRGVLRSAFAEIEAIKDESALPPLLPGTPEMRPRGHAAVTILWVPSLQGDSVDLVVFRKNAKLRHHASQLAFPGGKKDPEDASFLDCALRELHEELGVEASQVEMLRALDHSFLSFGSFLRVSAFVGISECRDFAIDPKEVQHVVRIPLAHVLSDEHYDPRGKMGMWRGPQWIADDDGPLWGFSARVLAEFCLELDRSLIRNDQSANAPRFKVSSDPCVQSQL